MNFLQRMPQSAKVALAAALLVGAVATWYLGFFRPSQTAAQPTGPTPAPAPVQPGTPAAPPSPPTATAGPLEVLPLPFLVTEATRPAEPEEQAEAPAAAALTRPRVTVPPNPFVPLVVETVPAAIAQPSQPTPAIISQPTPPVVSRPIPSQTAQVQIRQPSTTLPRPSLPGTRPTPGITAAPTPSPTPPTTLPPGPSGQARLAQGTSRASLPPVVSLGSGSLPIRLAPLERELSTVAPEAPKQAAALDVDIPAASGSGNLDFARAEIDARLTQVLEPRSNPVRGQEAVQESALARYVREQNLKLSGVVLGPTSVAIFQSKDGYVVLPVGRTLPGSDVLLRSLSAKEALLVRGSESLNLTMENP